MSKAKRQLANFPYQPPPPVPSGRICRTRFVGLKFTPGEYDALVEFLPEGKGVGDRIRSALFAYLKQLHGVDGKPQGEE